GKEGPAAFWSGWLEHALVVRDGVQVAGHLFGYLGCIPDFDLGDGGGSLQDLVVGGGGNCDHDGVPPGDLELGGVHAAEVLVLVLVSRDGERDDRQALMVIVAVHSKKVIYGIVGALGGGDEGEVLTALDVLKWQVELLYPRVLRALLVPFPKGL